MTSTSPAASTPSHGSRRKLIEVSLPLEAINEESQRESYIYKGNPSAVHKWWAQRPLAAARAVLFAQLVDDPSSNPGKFPSEQSRKAERERLHGIIRRLVKWENISNESLLHEAHSEIVASAPGGRPPAILDPFAGGGTIPLEAQRLGLEAHASDLNPVAVLINKALVEIPPLFAGRAPIYPGAAEAQMGAWPRATGLAEDVRRYGAWIRDRAWERVGHLYPEVELPTGVRVPAMAWIWARTVTCPNPACGLEMPLVRSWELGKKKGKEAYVVARVVPDSTARSGRGVDFAIGHGARGTGKSRHGGTAGGSGATCLACETAVDLRYIQAEGQAERMGTQMMAVVAEGSRQRVYLTPDTNQLAAASAGTPSWIPEGDLPDEALGFRIQNYGMTRWADLFTSRQLVGLGALSELVDEARETVLNDALATGMPEGERLSAGGADAAAYADAVATYLAFAIDKHADYGCSLVPWYPQEDRPSHLFGLQAIPMVWDFAEVSPFTRVGGGFEASVRIVSDALANVGLGTVGFAEQADAATVDYTGLLISTDPPYYNNIGYSDLSDFFYVWLRRSLRSVYPDLFATMLVPKAEELVANPFRHGGGERAEAFFQEGFERVFGRARESASDNFPITVFYAFKQTELEKEGVASTGWSTFLEGLIREGWMITATWPVRSERSGRKRDIGSNALASSIILALRPREITAGVTDRSGFLRALHLELARALPEIRQGSIAPADIRQTVLGPGMAVFSQYSRVLEDDGAPMSVKTALALINQTFDGIESEQDVELDADTRFCLDWYRSYGWATRPYGDAESLAVPLGLSVGGVARGGVIVSGGGKVALVKPLDLNDRWDPQLDDRLSMWEATCHLARVYATSGREDAARLMAGIGTKVDLDEVKRLATRLYELMESKDAATAGLFNGLGGAWSDVAQTASSVRPAATQGDLFEGDEG